MKITSCKEYNRKAHDKYSVAVREWKLGEPFPSICFYIFQKLNGEPKKYGYVLESTHGAQWYKTKKEALRGIL